MDFKEFVQLVKQMRSAQKKYFRFRTKDTLRESISFEVRVDKFIQDFSHSQEV